MAVPNHLPKPDPATVGIVLPTLGRPEPLRRTIEQLHAQRYTDWVCVIVDQNPTPVSIDPPELRDMGVQEYVPDLQDYRRFVVVHAPWLRGSSTARHLGMAVVQELGCQYLAFVDDDDAIDPEYLGELANILGHWPDASLAACDLINLRDGDGHPAVLDRSLYAMPTRMLRLADYRGERFDDTGPAQDHRFWMQFEDRLTIHCGRALYTAQSAPDGGLRSRSGRY